MVWVCWVSSVAISSGLRQSLLSGEETLLGQEIKEPLKVQEAPGTSKSMHAPSQGYQSCKQLLGTGESVKLLGEPSWSSQEAAFMLQWAFW